jgi:hypothetical protein
MGHAIGAVHSVRVALHATADAAAVQLHA